MLAEQTRLNHVCSCHFQNRNKINGPTILPHRLKLFDIHHITPEKKKTARFNLKLSGIILKR